MGISLADPAPQSVGSFAADAMRPDLYRIEAVTHHSPSTFSWELVPVVGSAEVAFRFRPGQFNMLYQFGVGEVPISISGEQNRPRLVHTIRAVGAVTNVMQGLIPGAVVGVRGPFGSHWPVIDDVARGKDIVIIAGGLGLPPLRPAIYYLLRHREDFGRLAIIYGARTPADLLFVDELKTWATHSNVQLELTVDAAPAEPGVTSAWYGHVGLVTRLIPSLRVNPANSLALMCGPEVMMRFAARDLLALGIPAGAIFLSMERNMQCAIGWCGHCMLGPEFICKDGPVFAYPRLQAWLARREA